MAKTIEDLYKQQLEAEKAQLSADYNKAISSLDAQKEENEKQTRKNIGLAKADNQMASVNNAEYYAAAGLTSGAKAQADLAQANQYQANVTALRAAQQEADNAIELQRQDLANQYAAAIKQAQADNDMALAEALYKKAKEEENQNKEINKTESVSGIIGSVASNVVDSVVNAVTKGETLKPTESQAITNLDKFAANTAQTVMDPKREQELVAAEINKYIQAGVISKETGQSLWEKYYDYEDAGSVPISFLKQMDAWALENTKKTVIAEIDKMLQNKQISEKQANNLKQRYSKAGMTSVFDRMEKVTAGMTEADFGVVPANFLSQMDAWAKTHRQSEVYKAIEEMYNSGEITEEQSLALRRRYALPGNAIGDGVIKSSGINKYSEPVIQAMINDGTLKVENGEYTTSLSGSELLNHAKDVENNLFLSGQLPLDESSVYEAFPELSKTLSAEEKMKYIDEHGVLYVENGVIKVKKFENDSAANQKNIFYRGGDHEMKRKGQYNAKF